MITCTYICTSIERQNKNSTLQYMLNELLNATILLYDRYVAVNLEFTLLDFFTLEFIVYKFHLKYK